MAPAAPGSLDEAKLRARAVRGHLTRYRTSCSKAIENLKSNPSAWAKDAAEETFKKASDQYDALLPLYQECMLRDDPTEAASIIWESKVAEISLDMDILRTKLQEAVNVLLAKNTATTTAPAPVSTASRIRVVDTLKPFVLAISHTPVEFRDWKRKLGAFFSASHLALASLSDQQAYARQFLEPGLDARIATLLLDSTPITGTDSITSFLDEVFEQRYPLFTRRLEFFRLTRTAGMQPSEYIAKMLQLAGEADLASLTTDRYIKFLQG